MGVSENSVTPKSSISIGFSIINHPFWGTTIFLETSISMKKDFIHQSSLVVDWPLTILFAHFRIYRTKTHPPKKRTPFAGPLTFSTTVTNWLSINGCPLFVGRPGKVWCCDVQDMKSLMNMLKGDNGPLEDCPHLYIHEKNPGMLKSQSAVLGRFQFQ